MKLLWHITIITPYLRTDKLSTAVMAERELLSDSRFTTLVDFFFAGALVNGLDSCLSSTIKLGVDLKVQKPLIAVVTPFCSKTEVASNPWVLLFCGSIGFVDVFATFNN